MNNKLEIKIVTPQKLYLEVSADMVTAPGREGEFGILPAHMPILYTLKSGYIKIFNQDKISQKIFITSGICQLENNQCMILAEEIIEIKSQNKEDIKNKILNLENKISDQISSNNYNNIDLIQEEIFNLHALHGNL